LVIPVFFYLLESKIFLKGFSHSFFRIDPSS